MKNTTQQPFDGNGLVQLIIVGKFIRLKGVKLNKCDESRMYGIWVYTVCISLSRLRYVPAVSKRNQCRSVYHYNRLASCLDHTIDVNGCSKDFIFMCLSMRKRILKKCIYQIDHIFFSVIEIT